MAWTTPTATTVGQVVTSAFMNTNVINNLTALTNFSNSIVTTSSATNNTAYGAMAGPAVTITTGTSALVGVYARISNDTVNGGGAAAFAVSGATTIAANQGSSCMYTNPSSTVIDSLGVRLGAVFIIPGLTAGSNTFTMNTAAVGTGTATFVDRRIWAWGLPTS